MSHLNEDKAESITAILGAGTSADWTLVELQRATLLNSKSEVIGPGFKAAIVGKIGRIHVGQGQTPIKAIENAKCMAKISEQGWS